MTTDTGFAPTTGLHFFQIATQRLAARGGLLPRGWIPDLCRLPRMAPKAWLRVFFVHLDQCSQLFTHGLRSHQSQFGAPDNKAQLADVPSPISKNTLQG